MEPQKKVKVYFIICDRIIFQKNKSLAKCLNSRGLFVFGRREFELQQDFCTNPEGGKSLRKILNAVSVASQAHIFREAKKN